MNLFRSEEDTLAWTDFNPETETAIKPVREWAAMFQGAHLFQRRLDDDFAEKSREYANIALSVPGEAISQGLLYRFPGCYCFGCG